LYFGSDDTVSTADPTPIGPDGVAMAVSPAQFLKIPTFPALPAPYTICVIARHTGPASSVTRSLVTLRSNTTNIMLVQRYSTGEFRAYVNANGKDIRGGSVDHL